MKRRALLGTIATTAFAGCAGVLGDSADPPTDDPITDEPTDSPDPTTNEPTNSGNDDTTDGDELFNYSIQDVQTDEMPVENVTIDVTIEESFTMEHPATLRVAFTNDADEAREFQFGSLVPWDGVWGANQDGDGELLLAPGTGVVPDEPEDNCWRAKDNIALPMVMKTETLDPGETRSHDFHVVAKHGTDACHPTGMYRFEDEGYLGEGWGFSFNLVQMVESESE